jgi:hypothetical protein
VLGNIVSLKQVMNSATDCTALPVLAPPDIRTAYPRARGLSN